MSKAFTRESEEDDDLAPEVDLPPGQKNYITVAGYGRLKDELRKLVESERPQVVTAVSWAASNGDRSENGDYIYGKKRLREIDRRIRFLIKRLEAASVVDPSQRGGAENADQIFFGATVRYADKNGIEHMISIVGVDEIDPSRGRASWISPIAMALIKAREGDTVILRTPSGKEPLDILEVRYLPLD